MCGWYYAVWMDETLPSEFIIFKDDDELLEDAIGVEGWQAENLVPFPMDVFYDSYTSKTLYFIADPEKVEELMLEKSITEVEDMQSRQNHVPHAVLREKTRAKGSSGAIGGSGIRGPRA